MYLAKIIAFISIIIWLLPPFRQLKGGFFLYFLISGFSDPITLFSLWLLKTNPIYIHLFISFLLAISILYYYKNLTTKWLVTLIIILIISSLVGDKDVLFIPIIIFRLFIVVQLFIDTASDFLIKKKVSLYISLLLFYELTIIFKYTAVGFNYSTGIYLYYLTSAIDVFVCIFFVLYNLQNSPFIKLSFSNNSE